jgi:uncharacterized protein YjbI with pentapeptide repeats
MANPEHLSVLRQGVEAWNEWRPKNPSIIPDLKSADLSEADLSLVDLIEADLSGANLRSANLIHADLIHADLSRADLSKANLNVADLSGANLREAKLSEAKLSGADLIEADLIEGDLSGADLSGADLSGANLRSANLSGANLSGADLRSANLSGADVGRMVLSRAHLFATVLANTDLGEVKGLESIIHRGPSTIGIDTFFRSRGKIPEAFLRGAGVPDIFIQYAASLVGVPFEFYSCFISYSSKDEALAERLHADLQGKGVRCWFAPHDLKTGDRFRIKIDEAVRLYDKLLLLLSKNSLGSDWVEKEVETAFEKERRQKQTVLFPVRLDGSVMKTESGWPADIRRTRHIGDFTHWKRHDAYKEAFNRLLWDLKADKAPAPTSAKVS